MSHVMVLTIVLGRKSGVHVMNCIGAGRVPSVRFRMVEKRYALAAWLPQSLAGSHLGRGCIPVCTAQGGSGSFKDRKPIGEVRCCESWMAEQIH